MADPDNLDFFQDKFQNDLYTDLDTTTFIKILEYYQHSNTKWTPKESILLLATGNTYQIQDLHLVLEKTTFDEEQYYSFVEKLSISEIKTLINIPCIPHKLSDMGRKILMATQLCTTQSPEIAYVIVSQQTEIASLKEQITMLSSALSSVIHRLKILESKK